jgi:nucleoside-diphosphate-sugar epimerase
MKRGKNEEGSRGRGKEKGLSGGRWELACLRLSFFLPPSCSFFDSPAPRSPIALRSSSLMPHNVEPAHLMRVFLTGATGHIGSAVCEALVRSGHQVSALVRQPARTRRLQQRGVTLLKGDLADIECGDARLSDFEAYVHTAFDSSARGVELDRRAIEIIRDAAGRSGRSTFIYTSGLWVLGSTTGPVDEGARTNPPALVAYRADHERLVREAHDSRLRTIVVRPGIVYGGSRGIVAEMLRDAGNGIMRVIGAGENHWPLVYDRDVAELYARLLTHGTASGIYHATDEADESVNDLVGAMATQMAFRPAVRHMPLAEARARLGAFADLLALDQIVRCPRAKEIGWKSSLKSVSRNVPRLMEEWRNSRG